MKRSHQPTPTNLRKSRITNKARLRIHRGNLESTDPFLLDPDQAPPAQTRNYGLDSEDANEHHLQQVLSAAAEFTQNTSTSRAFRGAATRTEAEKPGVFIPTPDSTGIVADYDTIYQPKSNWVDPVTYVKSSQTVEQAIEGALADDFVYYMDERDKEWLDKHNSQAKGEGTSTQGVLAANNARNLSSRSSKSKGKELEVESPVVVSDDNFELVMGVFEKVTYEKTEYLHHGFHPGTPFPPFADYQDTFANPLAPVTFASYTIPTGIPEPAQLVRIARSVYPHWRERRIERTGHRVIPVLNGNEADTLNESYICFRRREIKAVRKTRASQVTSTDKLIRLNAELASVSDLVILTMKREQIKKESGLSAASVWEKRQSLVDLKRKFSSLGDKTDEELLLEKERAPKKPKLGSSLKVRATDSGSSVIIPETTIIRPRERFALIQANIDRDLSKLKDRDNHWDDTVDAAYQPPPVPFAARAFKYISPSTQTTKGSLLSSDQPQPIALRLRRGRGGRIMVDRRDAGPYNSSRRRSHLLPNADSSESDSETAERNERLMERWRFDADDVPAAGPEGSDELDRMLLDDYDARYLAHMSSGFKESDIQLTKTDAVLHITGKDGRVQPVLPYRLGAMPVVYPARSREQPVRAEQATPTADAGGQPTTVSLPPPAVPVSQQTQLKKMPPPAMPRAQADGIMRPSAVPAAVSMPPPAVPGSQPQPNGTRNAIIVPHVDANGNSPNHVKHNGATNTPSPSIPNGVIHPSSQQSRLDHNVSPPARPPSQTQQQNGYHYPPPPHYLQHNPPPPNSPLNTQQMHNLKSAMANAQQQNINNNQPCPPYSVPINGTACFVGNPASNMQLKLPATRSWSQSVQRPHPMS